MYRPVGDTRRNHAKKLLGRAGYDDGGVVADAGIEPDDIPPEGPNPTSGPAPFAKPRSSPRRLGRRALKKLRP